jgi:Uma2 family endonuclease
MTADPLAVEPPAPGPSWLPDRPLTWADLQALPGAAHRYELVDGELIVAPSPGYPHQKCVANLLVVLIAAAPADLDVLPAPFDYVPAPGQSYQPDVVVVRAEAAGQRPMTEPPLLAVEVLSPHGRTTDTVTKRAVYARYGVPTYWIVDPEVPMLTVLHRFGDAYEEVAAVVGEQAYEASRPYPVTVVPARLLRRA